MIYNYIQTVNIKFTFEIENDDKTLPFLDISIKRVNGNFETSVYRKQTFTGLFTNFESFLPTAFTDCCFHFLSLVSLLQHLLLLSNFSR
jgi:hypothetical protein